MKPWKNILLASLYTLALGCGGNTSSGLADSPSEEEEPGSGSTAEDPDAPAGSPLYLIVTSTLDGESTSELETTNCHIPSGTPVGTPGVPSAAYASCTVEVPELVLYHSKLTFKMGTTSAATCERVQFKPFYYTRSIGMLPIANGAPLDCSSFPMAKTCFGGAGPAMIEDFPNNRTLIRLADNELFETYELPSSYSRKEEDVGLSIWQETNADSANNLFDTMIVDNPHASVYLDADQDRQDDYVVSCEDDWGTPLYTLTLKIRDEDSTGGGFVFDHFWDWTDP